jgi:hypothetical protein
MFGSKKLERIRSKKIGEKKRGEKGLIREEYFIAWFANKQARVGNTPVSRSCQTLTDLSLAYDFSLSLSLAYDLLNAIFLFVWIGLI